MVDVQKIGTVEMFRVNSSGRRLYVNLRAELCNAFGIKVGDLLKVEIKEKVRPEEPWKRLQETSR